MTIDNHFGLLRVDIFFGVTNVVHGGQIRLGECSGTNQQV